MVAGGRTANRHRTYGDDKTDGFTTVCVFTTTQTVQFNYTITVGKFTGYY